MIGQPFVGMLESPVVCGTLARHVHRPALWITLISLSTHSGRTTKRFQPTPAGIKHQTQESNNMVCRRSLWVLLLCLPQALLAQQIGRLSFGRIELQMASTSVSETNSLLKTILSVTVTFLDASFFSAKDYVFNNVACSIVSYKLGGGAGNGMFYANVTIGGSVQFEPDSGVDQREVLDLAAEAFEDGYIEALSNADEAFLQNLQSISLTLNGKTLFEETDGIEIMGDDSGDESDKEESSKAEHLAIWMVATIAGGAAFMCVICIAFACVCCIPRASKNPRRKGKALGIITAGNSDPTDDEDAPEEKTPSPARSLMSQDSSVFTYNPKSVSKLKSDEEDDSPKNNPWKPVSSKPSKDLSLIEECSENSSEQSTPRGKLEQGNLTSLLSSPISPGPGYDFEATYNPLTEESIRELEWAAERSLAFNTDFNENCSPFGKCQAPDDEDESFFADLKPPGKESRDVENAACDFEDLRNQFEHMRGSTK